jgi:hypothetical protein
MPKAIACSVGEARVHARELDEAANEEAGAGQQHDRQRHLRDDERSAQTLRAASGGAAVAALAQRIRDPAACRLQRRQNAEGEAGQERRGQREERDRAVEAHVLEARNVCRLRGDQGSSSPERDRESGRAAGEAEDERFGEELTEQPSAAGAERDPHREFGAARRRAREQQVGHVRAGDEEHEADGAE